jgi:thiosulfate/3-mercaptopyruvate sulfurtransferase
MRHIAPKRSRTHQSRIKATAKALPRQRQDRDWLLLFASFIALFLLMTLTSMASPLVTPQWLSDNLEKKEIRILDLQPAQGYQRAHLQGAVNTNYGAWRKTDAEGRPKMLPEISYLEAMIGTLGISNDSHVILAPLGINASEIAVATRIYWTFKALGHDNVSILDGGLIAYSQLKGAKFTIVPAEPTPQTFKAKPRPEYFPSGQQVLAAWEKGMTMVDSRSTKEYTGTIAAPGERAGTIPSAINLPFDRLVGKGQGAKFFSKEESTALFKEHNVPVSGPQISFCHTGHRTSLSWFVAHELLGNKQAKMYDGSMVEWAKDKQYPVKLPK